MVTIFAKNLDLIPPRPHCEAGSRATLSAHPFEMAWLERKSVIPSFLMACTIPSQYPAQ
jgi:hypothetical protein